MIWGRCVFRVRALQNDGPSSKTAADSGSVLGSGGMQSSGQVVSMKMAGTRRPTIMKESSLARLFDDLPNPTERLLSGPDIRLAFPRSSSRREQVSR